MDDLCAPCADGITYWPCNVQNECFCKDLAAEAKAEAAKEEAELGLTKCDLPLCQSGESRIVFVPYSDCREYVVCSNGEPGGVQTCSAGQAFDANIQACNVLSLVVCPEDPTCPPTMNPTPGSTDVPTMEGMDPTYSPAPTFASTSEGDDWTEPGGNGVDVTVDNVEPGGGGGTVDNVQSEPTTATSGGSASSSRANLDPNVLEGMYVMDAHMAANKIVLTRELLSSPGMSRGKKASNDFSYMGFRSSLHSMITTGAANQTFYIGHHGVENGRAYGLVNIAAFLAMSAEDSIMHGSCDEVNSDVVGGLLPISNACGQNGMSYQDMTCPSGDEIYNCEVDVNMRLGANPVNAQKAAASGNDNPPDPFYCGPTTDYQGYTGHWDYASGNEYVSPPVANELGRKDVQGCCWWGRGSIQLRGVCAYGKLNYHLGKRANDEGRPAMFPDVDFCRNPQAVCSHEKYPDLKWIAGMFRWITEVQTYDRGEFSYMQRLINFVDGGLQDWSFVHGVSGLVTQGCHEPPCIEGVEFDGAGRKATFIKTLKLLGLSVNEKTATGRRLGELST